jgi:hypothetical protein
MRDIGAGDIAPPFNLGGAIESLSVALAKLAQAAHQVAEDGREDNRGQDPTAAEIAAAGVKIGEEDLHGTHADAPVLALGVLCLESNVPEKPCCLFIDHVHSVYLLHTQT